jgi:hypothetical protein
MRERPFITAIPWVHIGLPCIFLLIFFMTACSDTSVKPPESSSGAVVTWDTATLRLDERGYVTALEDTATHHNYARPGYPFCRFETDDGVLEPLSVRQTDNLITFTFPFGAIITFRVTPGTGHSWWEVTDIAGYDLARIHTFRLAHFHLNDLPTFVSGIGALVNTDFVVALMGTHPNVENGLRGYAFDSDGVSHILQPETHRVAQGKISALFSATSTRNDTNDWSAQGRKFLPTQDLTGLTSIKVWVYGDSKGEELKIQLLDEYGGYRDDYIIIDFTGWKEVTCQTPNQGDLALDRVSQIVFYYNSLPHQQTVACYIDAVRAVVDGPTGTREIMLEDFEDLTSPIWDDTSLAVETYARHGVLPAGVGIVAAPAAQFSQAVESLEQASGLPSPFLDGVWAKESSRVKKSYLFITAMHESDTADVASWAGRGGFDTILMDSRWTKSHGHYQVNTDYFPNGLTSLQSATIQLKNAGFHVGLHFLAAAVDVSDPYVTPTPDPRLVKDFSATLSDSVDATIDFIPTTEAPSSFPAEDGGYYGSGTYAQIGDEIVKYSALSLSPPYGFVGCIRGALGTTPTTHNADDLISHLAMSYGYFLFDLDSSLATEVTGHVCDVANAIGADMLYMDGSERLQGEEWYYNAKLQGLYYNCLDNKNTLLQGSGYSPYSWHIVARFASADGNGDVKGYLDQRLPTFADYALNRMPLDIGWYYVYDHEVTADQFEYILQKSLGFGASISVQTNPSTLRTHPEIGRIFDLVHTYEQLRLGGQVPESSREVLREPGREYRLLSTPQRWRRVAYGPWQKVALFDGTDNAFLVEPVITGASLGIQARCGSMVGPGTGYNDSTVTLEAFDDLTAYKLYVSADVTQSFTAVTQVSPTEACKVGANCGRFNATSASSDEQGWAAVDKIFASPVDVSAGIGFWLRGDGNGGDFKLQFADNNGYADYYIANNFTEWRYFQRLPEQAILAGTPPIDFHAVTHLTFYYNSLRAGKTVICFIDDVKALTHPDEPQLQNPKIRVDAQELAFTATVKEGERLIYFPNEMTEIVPDVAGSSTWITSPSTPITLDGPKTATFTADSASCATEVRMVQDLPEELPVQ